MIKIISSPCSGSKAYAKQCQEMGLDIQHEKLGKDGGVGCNMHKDEKGNFTTLPKETVFLIRNPLKIINSLKNCSKIETFYKSAFIEKSWTKEKTDLQVAIEIVHYFTYTHQLLKTIKIEDCVKNEKYNSHRNIDGDKDPNFTWKEIYKKSHDKEKVMFLMGWALDKGYDL